jgi:hypothetical protein
VPKIDDTQRRAITSLGYLLAVVTLGGMGLLGLFALWGLAWPWVVLLTVVPLGGIGCLSLAIQRVLEAKGGAAPPDPSKSPSRFLRMPSGWPPQSEGRP